MKMLTKVILYFVSYLVISANTIDDSILLTMDPKEVVNTFKSVVRSAYLKDLANDFATKAAQYLINEIKNKGKQITRINTKMVHRIPTPTYDHSEKYKDSILQEEEAWNLINDPSPDGDNLVREFAYLSDEEIGEGDSTKSRDIPVIGVTKINGVYFRRLLGVI